MNLEADVPVPPSSFVPIHWYSTDTNEFQQYVTNFHQQTGLDIWVTEVSGPELSHCIQGQQPRLLTDLCHSTLANPSPMLLNAMMDRVSGSDHIRSDIDLTPFSAWGLHQGMAAWFDGQDFVKRYAPFGMMENMQGVNQVSFWIGESGFVFRCPELRRGTGERAHEPQRMDHLTGIMGKSRQPVRRIASLTMRQYIGSA